MCFKHSIEYFCSDDSNQLELIQYCDIRAISGRQSIPSNGKSEKRMGQRMNIRNAFRKN